MSACIIGSHCKDLNPWKLSVVMLMTSCYMNVLDKNTVDKWLAPISSPLGLYVYYMSVCACIYNSLSIAHVTGAIYRSW